MKKNYRLLFCLLLGAAVANAQTLTLVTGKKLYEHHSSSLSGNSFYGNYNVNTQSAYDFVNHTNVPSASAVTANKDLVEHNGYFGNNGPNGWGLQFGFTNAFSNVGNTGYPGNNISRFYLNNAVTFNALNTVSDLVAAYNSTLAAAFDTAVAVGNIYIGKIRNNGQYVAMRITQVSNITSAQAIAMDNGQNQVVDVFFEFEYKWGIYVPPVATGIAGYNRDQALVDIYPSPAATQLFLSATGGFDRYRITTLTGALAQQDFLNSATIDVSGLKTGIYFLELMDGAGVLQRNKFVKE